MKTITAATLAASITLLAACAQSGNSHSHHHHDHGHHHHHKVDMSKPMTFECNNGMTVNVQKAGQDKVKLTVENRSAVLTQTSAASGELYTGTTGLWGTGAEWHQKGSEAHFAYTGLHGAKGATACYHGK
ncbi:lysozyme inhibitor [Neisseria brasiliensis]|uniref:MliC family protein n=1 Tax=Neisseria TaxID=482 RepID=UPI000C27FC22|nr:MULTISPECIES: MliC family protein [Neisseria]PJO77612.1 lysozyme inhibitor [Neisseria sp. N177_16]QGL25275.1 lysozyme inhibitor [Neisseria brasiliensis]